MKSVKPRADYDASSTSQQRLNELEGLSLNIEIETDRIHGKNDKQQLVQALKLSQPNIQYQQPSHDNDISVTGQLITRPIKNDKNTIILFQPHQQSLSINQNNNMTVNTKLRNRSKIHPISGASQDLMSALTSPLQSHQVIEHKNHKNAGQKQTMFNSYQNKVVMSTSTNNNSIAQNSISQSLNDQCSVNVSYSANSNNIQYPIAQNIINSKIGADVRSKSNEQTPKHQNNAASIFRSSNGQLQFPVDSSDQQVATTTFNYRRANLIAASTAQPQRAIDFQNIQPLTTGQFGSNYQNNQTNNKEGKSASPFSQQISVKSQKWPQKTPTVPLSKSQAAVDSQIPQEGSNTNRQQYELQRHLLDMEQIVKQMKEDEKQKQQAVMEKYSIYSDAVGRTNNAINKSNHNQPGQINNSYEPQRALQSHPVSQNGHKMNQSHSNVQQNINTQLNQSRITNQQAFHQSQPYQQYVNSNLREQLMMNTQPPEPKLSQVNKIMRDYMHSNKYTEQQVRNDLQTYANVLVANQQHLKNDLVNNPIINYLMKNNVIPPDDNSDSSNVPSRHTFNTSQNTNQNQSPLPGQQIMSRIHYPPQSTSDYNQLANPQQSRQSGGNQNNRNIYHQQYHPNKGQNRNLSRTPKLTHPIVILENQIKQTNQILETAENKYQSVIKDVKCGDQLAYRQEQKPKKSIDLQKIEITPNEKTIYFKRDGNELGNLQSLKKGNQGTINNLINSGTAIVNSTPKNKILVINSKKIQNPDYQIQTDAGYQAQRKSLQTASAFTDQRQRHHQDQSSLDQLHQQIQVNSQNVQNQIQGGIHRNPDNRHVLRAQSSVLKNRSSKNQAISAQTTQQPLTSMRHNEVDVFDSEELQIQQQDEQMEAAQTLFINHGDINININITDSEGNERQDPTTLLTDQFNNLPTISKQQLYTWIQQYIQQQKRQENTNPIHAQIENFAKSVTTNMGKQTPMSTNKQRMNKRKKYSQSPNVQKQPNNEIVYGGDDNYEQGYFTKKSSSNVRKSQKNIVDTNDQQKRSKQQNGTSSGLSQCRQSKSQVSQTGSNQFNPNASTNQPLLNQSMSKRQLKKQVVQYYWQHLIQSYGNERKQLKLDVKGRTINNGPIPVGIINSGFKSTNSANQQKDDPYMKGYHMSNSIINSLQVFEQIAEHQKYPGNRNNQVPGNLASMKDSSQPDNRFKMAKPQEVFIHVTPSNIGWQQCQQQNNNQNKYNEQVQINDLTSTYAQGHVFDQFGEHSDMCRCLKQQTQSPQQATNNSRSVFDPYQRLNYIQKISLQDRQAAQLYQQTVDALKKKEEELLKLNQKRQIVKKPKPPPAPQTRLEIINDFIQKLNLLISITLKATDSINPISLNTIKKLGSELGIKWPGNLDAKFIKSKDFVTFLKSKIYCLLNNVLVKNTQSMSFQVQLILNQNILNNKLALSKLLKEQSVLMNDQFLNQVHQFNTIKIKNFGFKFWVECPTIWANNFIIVKNVVKKRTWLSWVNYDPYEEREVNNTISFQQQLQQAQYSKSQSNNNGISKENSPDKNQKSNKKSPVKSKANQVQDEESESDDPESHKNSPIWPNLIFTQVRRVKIVKELLSHQIYNHIDGINQIAAKCQMHKNMKEYAINVAKESPWNMMPETYIVDLEAGTNKNVLDHEEFKEFLKSYKKGTWWIIKPGEDSNRGHGIKVLDNLQKIKELIIYEFNRGPKQFKTCIIQKYIENPLLIHKRKFDIRVFALLSYITNIDKTQGILRGWCYQEGYIRTSSKEFSLQSGDNQYVHLTNDAVQKQCQDYGKFEAGNKISYSDFDKFLIKNKETSFFDKILPKIKERVGDVFKSAGRNLVGEIRSDYNGFEWLGFDFMLDDELNLSLIEVNTNPCLETQSCILLQRLIPQMLDQSLKIAVDPFFGANENQYHMNNEFVATEIKHHLVFDRTFDNIQNRPTVSNPPPNPPSEEIQIGAPMQMVMQSEDIPTEEFTVEDDNDPEDTGNAY